MYLNIENIFFNGYLISPQEMIAFVDSFGSHARARPLRHRQHHAVPVSRALDPDPRQADQEHPLQGVSKKGTHEFNLDTFRPLLDGTTNWPAVMEALDKVGYRGYLTFEYFHPFQHYPEALVYQTSDSLDRMLGRKAAHPPLQPPPVKR